jgi:hypothetical protein
MPSRELIEGFGNTPVRQPHRFVDGFTVQRPWKDHAGVAAFSARYDDFDIVR